MQTFLRTVARVVGSEVIDDVVAFFRAFEGMEEGFRDRAHGRWRRSSPTPATGVRARDLAAARRDARRRRSSPSRSRQAASRSQALIVNRVHPSFGDEAPAGLRAAAEELGAHRERRRRRPARRALRQPRRLPRDRRSSSGRTSRGCATGSARDSRRRTCPTSPTTSTTSPRSTRSAGCCCARACTVSAR